MNDLLRVIESGTEAAAKTRFPIVWSEARIEALRTAACGEPATTFAIDAALAGPLLQCANGQFDEAESEIVRLLRDNMETMRQNVETFISLLNAAFVVQRMDLVAAMLRDRYGYGPEFAVEVRNGAAGHGRVRWEAPPTGPHRFIFDDSVYKTDSTRVQILAFQWEFPLLSYYSRQKEQETGSLVLNQWDAGLTPGLAYCDSRPEYFLIPDFVFVPSKGYRVHGQEYKNNNVSWSDRKPLAFWRGGTTGIQARKNDWASLERVKLCELARRHSQRGLFDVAISGVAQISDPTIVSEIQNSGLIGSFVRWQDWNKYKYHIDIDGNTNAWSGLFQRLLTGSPVLKVASAGGFRQWYYDKLEPWRNYVPIAPDMSDLVDKIEWLSKHDAAAQTIGRRGLELAEHLSYESELERSVPVISAAFRYFRGDYADPAPCGQVGAVA